MCKPHFFYCKKIVFFKIKYYNEVKVGDKMSKTKKKHKKKIKNIFYLSHFMAKAFLMAVFGIMTLICLVAIVYFGDIFINLHRGEYKYPLFGAYVIATPSMTPTINVKDGVLVKRSSKNELKIGDIITFSSSDLRYSGLIITHRIVEKEKLKSGDVAYRTKGDNNRSVDDATVLVDNIYGRVIFKVPKIGYVKDFFAQPLNFILVFVGVIAIVFVYDGIRIALMLDKKA